VKNCSSIPFLLNHVSTAIWRTLGKRFKESGIDLTPEQWSLLAQLWQADGKNQQELCDCAHRDKPSTTRLIDNMVKKGLVERVPCQVDRRANLIYVTPKGWEFKNISMQLATETFQDAMEGIGEQEVLQCKATLERMLANIFALEQTCAKK